mmetsp:Transcript_3009/g.9035  ORF Transcript_3009/g.9035 Transcript_3009/m.9035 type:complete len:200 (+) Transcript_3009:193-792(+)
MTAATARTSRTLRARATARARAATTTPQRRARWRSRARPLPRRHNSDSQPRRSWPLSTSSLSSGTLASAHRRACLDRHHWSPPAQSLPLSRTSSRSLTMRRQRRPRLRPHWCRHRRIWMHSKLWSLSTVPMSPRQHRLQRSTRHHLILRRWMRLLRSMTPSKAVRPRLCRKSSLNRSGGLCETFSSTWVGSLQPLQRHP